MDTLSSRIRALRLNQGMTQGALAAKLGVPVNRIEQWEHGRTPDEGELLALSAFFGEELKPDLVPQEAPDLDRPSSNNRRKNRMLIAVAVGALVLLFVGIVAASFTILKQAQKTEEFAVAYQALIESAVWEETGYDDDSLRFSRIARRTNLVNNQPDILRFTFTSNRREFTVALKEVGDEWQIVDIYEE